MVKKISRHLRARQILRVLALSPRPAWSAPITEADGLLAERWLSCSPCPCPTSPNPSPSESGQNAGKPQSQCQPQSESQTPSSHLGVYSSPSLFQDPGPSSSSSLHPSSSTSSHPNRDPSPCPSPRPRADRDRDEEEDQDHGEEKWPHNWEIKERSLRQALIAFRAWGKDELAGIEMEKGTEERNKLGDADVNAEPDGPGGVTQRQDDDKEGRDMRYKDGEDELETDIRCKDGDEMVETQRQHHQHQEEEERQGRQDYYQEDSLSTPHHPPALRHANSSTFVLRNSQCMTRPPTPVTTKQVPEQDGGRTGPEELKHAKKILWQALVKSHVYIQPQTRHRHSQLTHSLPTYRQTNR